MPFRERVLHNSKDSSLYSRCSNSARRHVLEGSYPCVTPPIRGWQLPSADDRLYPQKQNNLHPPYWPFSYMLVGVARSILLVLFFQSKFALISNSMQLIVEVLNSQVNIWLANSLVECPAKTCLSRDALSEQKLWLSSSKVSSSYLSFSIFFRKYLGSRILLQW